MTFYSTILIDGPADTREVIHFKVEATSAHEAVRLLSAYCKGRFEASGIGGEISSVSKSKTRGVEYRGL